MKNSYNKSFKNAKKTWDFIYLIRLTFFPYYNKLTISTYAIIHFNKYNWFTFTYYSLLIDEELYIILLKMTVRGDESRFSNRLMYRRVKELPASNARVTTTTTTTSYSTIETSSLLFFSSFFSLFPTPPCNDSRRRKSAFLYLSKFVFVLLFYNVLSCELCRHHRRK